MQMQYPKQLRKKTDSRKIQTDITQTICAPAGGFFSPLR
jgi:hypothetical protein